MNRPPLRRYRNIFIVGLPGVGKTSFGMAYATHTSRSFYDLDRMIEAEQGKTVAEIFADTASGGEQHFRQLEHHMLKKLALRQNVVIALGGGTPCSEESQRILREHGLVVQLRDQLPALVKRLRAARQVRPLLVGASDDEELLRLLTELQEARHSWYDLAHLTLDLSFASIDAAKIELAAFERRAFKRSYIHDLEALGEAAPEAPDIQVHPRARYVLRERPYLALVADFGRGGSRGTSGRTKRHPGGSGAGQGTPGAQKARKSRNLRSSARKKSQGPDGHRDAGDGAAGSKSASPPSRADGRGRSP